MLSKDKPRFAVRWSAVRLASAKIGKLQLPRYRLNHFIFARLK